MRKGILLTIIMLFSATLYAVPGFIVHQGYIENSDGTPLNGVIPITISIYGSPDGDDILFEQALDVTITDGFYTAEIDDAAIMPVFNVDKTLYLELTVNGQKGSPRQKIGSVPYSFYAAKAYDVIGDIHPNSIYINGTKVIDETGKYLGPVNAVTSITAGSGLKGGTITSTGTISLDDNYLSGEVYDDRFINVDEANSVTTNMIRDQAINSSKIADGSILLKHINSNNCANGQIMKYNSATGWECASDLNNTYSAGDGLTLAGNTFSVNFAGSGISNSVARSDHNHDGLYAPINHNHDSVYAPIFHNHDQAYVHKKGDTMFGKLSINIDAANDTPIALTTSNGSVLFEGPDGITPVKGAGIRLMWVPSKVALRVGKAVSKEWDDPFIGNSSYAFGEEVKAQGNYTFVAGYGIEANNDMNVIFGESNTSFGTRVFINGTKNDAYGDLIGILGNGNVANGSDNYIVGLQNTSEGSGNYIFGDSNYMDKTTVNTYAMGSRILFTNASDSVGIGSYINISVSNSVTIGKGDDLSIVGGPLTNDIPNSLMVGFNSTQPTLFVGPSSGGTTTGKVGIGTKYPVSKLDVDGGVRTIPYTIKFSGLSSDQTTTYIPDTPNIDCTEKNRGEIRVLTIKDMLGVEYDALCACLKTPSTNYSWHCYK